MPCSTWFDNFKSGIRGKVQLRGEPGRRMLPGPSVGRSTMTIHQRVPQRTQGPWLSIASFPLDLSPGEWILLVIHFLVLLSRSCVNLYLIFSGYLKIAFYLYWVCAPAYIFFLIYMQYLKQSYINTPLPPYPPPLPSS